MVTAKLKASIVEAEEWRGQAVEAREEIESLKLHIDALQSEKVFSSMITYFLLQASGFSRVSNVIDYSLTRNYVQLRVIIFISCNFAGLRVLGEIFISRHFIMITRNKRKYNYA